MHDGRRSRWRADDDSRPTKAHPWRAMRRDSYLRLHAAICAPHAILDHELPIYTVWCHYREGKFAPVLVEQLLALDYPQNQLQCCFSSRTTMPRHG